MIADLSCTTVRTSKGLHLEKARVAGDGLGGAEMVPEHGVRCETLVALMLCSRTELSPVIQGVAWLQPRQTGRLKFRISHA
eukprot:3919904-Rhodomonas_salina.5